MFMIAESAKLPIKDFKEAIVAMTALTVFGVYAYEKRDVDVTKLFELMAKFQLAADGYENILPEALDMDSEEAAEVIAAVAAEIKTSNEKAKAIVLASLAALPANIKLIKAISA